MVDVQQQVWAGVLSRGPSGQALQATYQHTSTQPFQQAVGACVLAAAQAMPDGLLVFTPSYSLLNSLSAAWKVSQLELPDSSNCCLHLRAALVDIFAVTCLGGKA